MNFFSISTKFSAQRYKEFRSCATYRNIFCANMKNNTWLRKLSMDFCGKHLTNMTKLREYAKF